MANERRRKAPVRFPEIGGSVSGASYLWKTGMRKLTKKDSHPMRDQTDYIFARQILPKYARGGSATVRRTDGPTESAKMSIVLRKALPNSAKLFY